MTRPAKPIRGHPCLYGSDSIQGCPRYDPVSAHSSRPGSDACRYLICTPVTNHHWQRQCVLDAPGNTPRQEIEGAPLAPNHRP